MTGQTVCNSQKAPEVGFRQRQLVTHTDDDGINVMERLRSNIVTKVRQSYPATCLGNLMQLILVTMASPFVADHDPLGSWKWNAGEEGLLDAPDKHFKVILCTPVCTQCILYCGQDVVNKPKGSYPFRDKVGWIGLVSTAAALDSNQRQEVSKCLTMQYLNLDDNAAQQNAFHKAQHKAFDERSFIRNSLLGALLVAPPTDKTAQSPWALPGMDQWEIQGALRFSFDKQRGPPNCFSNYKEILRSSSIGISAPAIGNLTVNKQDMFVRLYAPLMQLRRGTFKWVIEPKDVVEARRKRTSVSARQTHHRNLT